MSELSRIADALEGILAALQQQPTDVPLVVVQPPSPGIAPHAFSPVKFEDGCAYCNLPRENRLHGLSRSGKPWLEPDVRSQHTCDFEWHDRWGKSHLCARPLGHQSLDHQCAHWIEFGLGHRS